MEAETAEKSLGYIWGGWLGCGGDHWSGMEPEREGRVRFWGLAALEADPAVRQDGGARAP